eukprot:706196-Karenia_brevis.AAC.1
MFRCQQPLPRPPPPVPSDDVDLNAFDDLLTGSIQSDEPTSAFAPIPDSGRHRFQRQASCNDCLPT